MAERVTVYHIARAAGLSVSTVSRALNNSRLISDETRAVVHEVADHLGYERRVIRRQGSRAILNVKLFLPLAKYSYVHLFYDVADLVRGITEGFGPVKVNVITAINDGTEDHFRHKKPGDLDACVFAFCTPAPSLRAELRRREVPFVLLNRVSKEDDWVCYDDHWGMGRLVTALAQSRPHARPCFVGLGEIPASSRREWATKVACAELGLPLPENAVFQLESIEQIDGAVVPALAAGEFDAVLCFNDVFAVYLYQAALRDGLVPRQHFSLSGFDNSPILDLVTPRIDTVELSIRRLGHEAGRWLRRVTVDKLEDSLALKLRGTYLPGETL